MAVQVKILQRGSTSKVIFSVATTTYGINKPIDTMTIVSEQININNLVLADFKFLHYYKAQNQHVELRSANIIKAETANGPTVPLKINCNEFSDQLYCTDKSITAQISQVCKAQDHHYKFNGDVFVMTFIFEVDIIFNVSPITPLTTPNNLYEDTEFIDFELSTTDGSVPVHKAMLFMHSDMFKLMMRGEWKETSHGQISMDGVTVQILEKLKEYMYLGSLPDKEEEIEILLQIAVHYFMDKLKTDCIAKLSRSVTAENLDHLVQLACLHNLPDLVRTILLETPDDIINRGYRLKINNQQSDGQKSNS